MNSIIRGIATVWFVLLCSISMGSAIAQMPGGNETIMMGNMTGGNETRGMTDVNQTGNETAGDIVGGGRRK